MFNHIFRYYPPALQVKNILRLNILSLYGIMVTAEGPALLTKRPSR